MVDRLLRRVAYAIACAFLALVAGWLFLNLITFGDFSYDFDGDIRERQAMELMRALENSCRSYQKEHGRYPPMDAVAYRTGPAVEALVRSRSIELQSEALASWPVSAESHLLNPIGEGKFIHYRDNTRPAGDAMSGPPIGNKEGVDLWCEDRQGKPYGINNWR